jgi:23S rRNA (uracil1939-C5)-methyltransferase
VVLDPPRTGAKEIAAALASRPLPAVVYVSCDPPTLGRDLGVLAAAGYAPAAIETFEMFPQTSHVETIAALVPPKARR